MKKKLLATLGVLFLCAIVGWICVLLRGVMLASSADRAGLISSLNNDGKHDLALRVAQQWVTANETRYGNEHTNTALALTMLAITYRNMGDYTKAEPLYLRCLKIREKLQGQNHLATARSLNNLATLYHLMGDYAKAIPLCQRSLKIREDTQGPEHEDTASSASVLATLYEGMGDYEKAESSYQRSLRIRVKVFGMEDSDTVISLNDLAALYVKMGDYAKAKPLFQQCLDIALKVRGPTHSETTAYMSNLAASCQMMGEYETAERLLKQSIEITERVQGVDHPDVTSGKNNLAALYQKTGNYAKAGELYLQILKIEEKTLGPKHPDTATEQSNLAALYRDKGDYEKAEPLYRQSLAIKENILGPEHPSTVVSYESISLFEFELGHFAESLVMAQKFKAASEHNLSRLLVFASERQRMAYQAKEQPYRLFAMLGCAPDLSEALLRTKGIVLDSLLEDQLAAEASKNPEVKNTINQLHATGRRLNQLQMGIPKDISPEALKRRQTEREALEQQAEDLQKSLARNVAAIGQVRRALRIKTSDVQTVLPEKTVLMEFARYNHNLGKGKSEPRYGVVLIGNSQVMFKDAKPGEPVWVPLGPAKAIEQNLKEYVARMRGDIKGETNLLHTLYTQLFEPIQKRLPKDITTLIISPDAELNFVSFATFVDDQNKFLAEKFTLNYVASGRDLVLKRTSKKGPRRFAAFANPAFGEKPMLAGAHGTNAVQLAMLSSDQRDYAGVSLGALPNTMQEARFLRDRSSSWNMDGSVFARAEASEAEVKAVKSPYILHLATHGFFLDDKLTTTNRLATGRQLLGNDRAPIVPHNPMQRSGLAFAGAQLTLDAWKRGETPDTENDGILMGQEIGTMDLKETWLVVLSACDTGIGEARAGEGVLGLRRGFIQAGAQNLLMTLWPVSDKHTVDLMKAFYERALKDNNAPQALAEVQREFLVKIRNEKNNAVLAARLAGPFVMTFQGRN